MIGPLAFMGDGVSAFSFDNANGSGEEGSDSSFWVILLGFEGKSTNQS